MKYGIQTDLTGKVAFVTGGGGMLCGAMAKALAEAGAKVAIADLRKDAAEAVAKEINDAGGIAMGVECNVLNRESIEAANQEVIAKFGETDILINGAGGNHPKGTTSMEFMSKEVLNNTDENVTTFYDLDPDGIQFVFNLNFLGTLLPSQVLTKGMVKKGAGTIINISSMNAFTPLTKIPAYSAAKASISNFTQWLAVHMSKVGIRVNAIAPGFFLTDQNRSLLTNADGSYTARAEKILNNTPMGEFGIPEDLIGALLWLTSEKAARFVTGTVIPVDGGFAAYSGV